MTTERHELLAWLGDDHGLTERQIADLSQNAYLIAERYPDPDEADEREAALTMAYRLMVEDPEDVVAELAGDLTRARVAEARALAALRQGAVQLVEPSGRGDHGLRTQGGYAAAAGVDRHTVRRNWLGQ